jgi:hypothetical protein
MRKTLFAVAFLLICPVLIAQQALNNDGVLKLIKAGLSEDLVVSTINGSPGQYDTSVNGLIALKTGGATDKVVSAIVIKASGVTPAAPNNAPGAASALPPGIDSIGVYYKDKSGNWTALAPEIVNFKTGGFLKSLATDGIVKGDVNGHVVGPHSKTALTFPITIAVYVPEGTDIMEYQLLRFRAHSDNREFRSVTGGVFHASGGANRDLVDYKADKIAPRIFQIVLESALGKGEYGLIPPGSYSSSNMASGGKVYTVSVIE